MTTVVQIHHQDPRIHIYDNGTSIALLQGPAHDVTKAYDKNNLDPSPYGVLTSDNTPVGESGRSWLFIGNKLFKNLTVQLCGGDINNDFAIDAFKTANIIMLGFDSNHSIRGVLCAREVVGTEKYPMQDTGAFYYVDLICNAEPYQTASKMVGEVAVVHPRLAAKIKPTVGFENTFETTKSMRRALVKHVKGSQMLDLLKQLSINNTSQYLRKRNIPKNTPFSGIILRAIGNVVTYYYNLGWRFIKKCGDEEKEWIFGDIMNLLKIINIKKQFITNDPDRGWYNFVDKLEGRLYDSLDKLRSWGDDAGYLYTGLPREQLQKYIDEVRSDAKSKVIDFAATWGDKGTRTKVVAGDAEPTEGYTMIQCKVNGGYLPRQLLFWNSLESFLGYLKNQANAGDVATQIKAIGLVKLTAKYLKWMKTNMPQEVEDEKYDTVDMLLESYFKGTGVLEFLNKEDSKKAAATGGRKRRKNRKRTKKKALKKRHCSIKRKSHKKKIKTRRKKHHVCKRTRRK